MIQAFLTLIRWSLVGTDGPQLDALDSADLDRVGSEIQGIFLNGIVDDVLGLENFRIIIRSFSSSEFSGSVSQRPSTAGSIGVVCFSIRGASYSQPHKKGQLPL